MSVGALNSLNTLNRVNSSMNKTIQRMSTGSKHPGASYGPASYAIAQRTYSNIGAVNQANANTQNTNAMLNVAAGAVGKTVDSLTSLREKVLQAANGTNNSTDIENLQKVVDQTISQINENAGVTFNGQRLLDGSKDTFAVQSYDGYQNVHLGNMTAQGLGLADSEGNSTLNLSDLENDELTGDPSYDPASGAPPTEYSGPVGAVLKTVDDALNKALDMATTIGAQQQGLEFQSDNLVTVSENLSASVSTDDDVDMASEAVRFNSEKTQSQLAMFGVQAHMQLLGQRMGIVDMLK
jgi:flagellin